MQHAYDGPLRVKCNAEQVKVMDVIYGLIPSMIFIGIVLVIVLFWAIKSGQFDDFEGEAHRILMDEELVPEKPASEKGKVAEKTAAGKSSEEKNMQNNEKKQDNSDNSG